MSVVTLVPAFCWKAVCGRRIAPSSLARSAIHARAVLVLASMKLDDTTIATTPPGRVLATDFPKKKLWMLHLLRSGYCGSWMLWLPNGGLPITRSNESGNSFKSLKPRTCTLAFWYNCLAMRPVMESSSTPVMLDAARNPCGISPKKLPVPMLGSSTQPLLKPSRATACHMASTTFLAV